LKVIGVFVSIFGKPGQATGERATSAHGDEWAVIIGGCSLQAHEQKGELTDT